MGPVSMAVVLYVGERLLDRLVSGQLLRKGVVRKIRRLLRMILDVHVLYEMFYDYLEDIQ
jgi:Ni/Fe-hydrogenase subunit HybB-like protein